MASFIYLFIYFYSASFTEAPQLGEIFISCTEFYLGRLWYSTEIIIISYRFIYIVYCSWGHFIRIKSDIWLDLKQAGFLTQQNQVAVFIREMWCIKLSPVCTNHLGHFTGCNFSLRIRSPPWRSLHTNCIWFLRFVFPWFPFPTSAPSNPFHFYFGCGLVLVIAFFPSMWCYVH